MCKKISASRNLKRKTVILHTPTIKKNGKLMIHVSYVFGGLSIGHDRIINQWIIMPNIIGYVLIPKLENTMLL